MYVDIEFRRVSLWAAASCDTCRLLKRYAPHILQRMTGSNFLVPPLGNTSRKTWPVAHAVDPVRVKSRDSIHACSRQKRVRHKKIKASLSYASSRKCRRHVVHPRLTSVAERQEVLNIGVLDCYRCWSWSSQVPPVDSPRQALRRYAESGAGNPWARGRC